MQRVLVICLVVRLANWLWLREILKEGVNNKSNHRIQDPLLSVTEPRTRYAILLRPVCQVHALTSETHGKEYDGHINVTEDTMKRKCINIFTGNRTQLVPSALLHCPRVIIWSNIFTVVMVPSDVSVIIFRQCLRQWYNHLGLHSLIHLGNIPCTNICSFYLQNIRR
jgi:hypothetical protein